MIFLQSIFPRWVLSGVLLASGIAWEAPPVLLCAVVIGGSTVPMMWRALRVKGRLGGRRLDLAAVEDLLDQRLREFEDRQADEAASLERYHVQYYADLEERLDFAERVLAAEPAADQPVGSLRARAATPV